MDYATFFSQVIKKLSVTENKIYKKADKKDMVYLKSSKYPDCVLEFYNHKELQECIDINGARLWPIKNLKEENEDYTPGYIIYDLGYRVIGTTINGDVYCLDINQMNNDGQPIIFIASHDEIYEGLSNDEITSKIVKIADSFNEFLQKFIEETLPIDYYDVE